MTSDLVDKRFRFGLPIDVGAELNETLSHCGVSILAGLFQHVVMQL